uniref:Lens epithelium-derived growth factor integrase-binding domain-containing protein n=1 Tax=Timema douglasi TaxID=61478 RepID=A0A7R8VP98_TIMDO|nr:unnamed protein product [Timema douglasi]
MMPLLNFQDVNWWLGLLVLQLFNPIQIILLQPKNQTNKAARDRWDEACWINAQKLKQQIEEESYMPEYLKKQLEQRIKLREHEILQLGLENDADSFSISYSFMNTESRLMELDALIKSKLSLIKADPEKCLCYLTELGDLDVQPLMLKKHPYIVDTIKKLRRYIGNVEEWGYTGDKKSLFIQQAARIRAKAEYVFNKFKKLFVIPENMTFYQAFFEEVKKLKEHTVDMDAMEFSKLRKEPMYLPLEVATTVPPGIHTKIYETPEKFTSFTTSWHN